MKITIYTISDCKFSKEEKEYLKSHNLEYEEKNLELNKEWLNEMLIVSNNFAGTPVTKIEKDDGSIRVFKGFTKEEFDEFFGFIQPSQTSQNISPPVSDQLNQVVQSNPATSSDDNNQKSPSPYIDNSQPNQSNQPYQPDYPNNQKIDSVLNKLEEKTQIINGQDEQNLSQANLENTQPPVESSIPIENNSDIVDNQSQLNQVRQNMSQENLNQKPQNLPNIPDLPSDLKM